MLKSISTFLVFLSFIISNSAFAYNLNVANKEYSLESPYYTVLTHLKHLQKNTYHPEISAKTIYGDKYSQEEKQQYAIQLKKILDGNNLYVYADQLPQSNNYYDSSLNDSAFILFANFPQILVRKRGNQWYYTEQTITAIPELYNEVVPWWTQKIIGIIPAFGHKNVIGGIELWQLIGLLILIFISIILQKFLTFFFNRVIQKIVLQYDEKEIANKLINAVSKPISILVITWFLIETITLIQIPIKVTHYLIQVLKIVLSISSILVFYKLVDLVCMIFSHLASKTESTLDDQLIPLLSKALKVFVIISGFLVILQNLDIDITALLAGLSIGGLAFALAAQDTIKNLFGSIMIFIDRPFQIGDWIISDKVDGTVEEVGFRSTRVRTFANSLVTIPNGKLADLTVDNMGKRVFRRYSTKFGITYDTPPELIESFVEGIKAIVESHPTTRKDYYEIHLNDLSSSSLDIMIYVFFEVPDWSKELEGRHSFILEVLKLAEKLGVNFAFPTQTLHIENFPEKNSDSPNYTFSKKEQDEKIKTFIEEYKSRLNN